MASHLASVGWDVRALCRTEPNIPGRHIAHVPFDLSSASAHLALDDVDVLIHAAYDFGHTRWRDVERVNVAGSRRLLDAAQKSGVGCIVAVSTVAAFPQARSMYGRAKLEIERMTLACGGAVVRPGLVWGPHGAAMFGALRDAVARLPIVPLVVPADLGVTSVYEDDLALFLERLLERWPDASGRLFVAASEQMLQFGALLRALSAEGKRRHFVAVPWTLVWFVLRAIEALRLTPPFPSDRLLSLVNTDADPHARATGCAERYGVSFRPYSLT